MRARNIKPGFFDNEVLAGIGPCGQILFEGLWCLADREGRLEDRPIRIKAQIFPYYEPFISLTVNPPLDNGESTVTERLIQILSDKGFIMRYEVDGKRYIQIKNFLKHQSPHKTEKKSEIPPIPEGYKNNGEPTVNPPLDNGESRPDSLIHGFTDSLIQGSSSLRSEEPQDTPPAAASNHYSTKMCAEDLQAIDTLCKDLLSEKDSSTKRLNPHSVVQGQINQGVHPRAIKDGLQELYDKWETVDFPYKWLLWVIGKLDFQYQEQLRVQDKHEAERTWKTIADKLPAWMLEMKELPTNQTEAERVRMLKEQAKAIGGKK